MSDLADLTPRQLEILALHASGMTYVEIGSELFISPRTVEITMAQAKARLNAINLTHAVVLAVSRGFLCLDSSSEEIFVPEEEMAAA
jgi:DNA-binding CsgD family transcriptional regulator